MSHDDTVRADLSSRVEKLLAAHDPATTDRLDFLRARFDAGLAWVHFPEGLGGLRLGRHKYPRRIEVVDVLPMGPSHKGLKRELGAQFANNKEA